MCNDRDPNLCTQMSGCFYTHTAPLSFISFALLQPSSIQKEMRTLSTANLTRRGCCFMCAQMSACKSSSHFAVVPGGQHHSHGRGHV